MDRKTLSERLGALEETLAEIRARLDEFEDELDLEFIRIGDVAKMLGMDTVYVKTAIENSKHPLPYYQFGGKTAHRRYHRIEVLEWIEKHRHE